MAKRKKNKDSLKVTYQSTAEARAKAGNIPVFCAFDKLMDPKDLVGNPRNPNQHPPDQIHLLAHIIQSQGWRAPITVSNQSGFVVRGHGRLAAALEFGAECVPVDFQNYSSDAEEWADLIADNRLAELSEIDNTKIADLIADMDTGEVPIILSGYSEDDVANILDAIAGEGDSEADGADSEVQPPQRPMSKTGDLWLLGEHRVLCGSATNPADVERLMDGALAHMVFTDPPYGVSYTGGVGKTWDAIKDDDLTGDDLMATLLIPSFRGMTTHTTDTAAFYIWYPFLLQRDFEDAMTAVGLVKKQQIVWVKNNFQMGHFDYHWGHELCFYSEKAGHNSLFYGDRTNQTVWRVSQRMKNAVAVTVTGGIVLTDGCGGKIFVMEKPPKDKKARYIRVGEKDTAYLFSGSKDSTAWEVSRDTGVEHPTQKPVELATRAIENSSQEGEIILDLFGGSGTTLIGAELTNRKAYLTEIDPKYIDVIVNRYARVTGNVGGICIRDGKEIPYTAMLREWESANGLDSELR